MTDTAKKSSIFIDSVEKGWARVVTSDKKSFTIPISLLPKGIKEGAEVMMTCETTAAAGHDAAAIDDLLDSLGDDP